MQFSRPRELRSWVPQKVPHGKGGKDDASWQVAPVTRGRACGHGEERPQGESYKQMWEIIPKQVKFYLALPGQPWP